MEIKEKLLLILLIGDIILYSLMFLNHFLRKCKKITYKIYMKIAKINMIFSFFLVILAIYLLKINFINIRNLFS